MSPATPSSRSVVRIARVHRAPRLILLAAIGALLACSGGAAAPSEDNSGPGSALRTDIPSSAPAIRGTITQVVAGDSITASVSGRGANPDASVSCPPTCESTGRPIRSVLIEENPGTPSTGDKSLVRMPAGARVLRRTAASITAAGFADLRVGQRVSAWFDGPVAESYPSQARGLVVIIEP